MQRNVEHCGHCNKADKLQPYGYSGLSQPYSGNNGGCFYEGNGAEMALFAVCFVKCSLFVRNIFCICRCKQAYNRRKRYSAAIYLTCIYTYSFGVVF